MKVYTAGPLGFSEGGRLFHARIVDALQVAGHSVLDPWTFDPVKIVSLMGMPYGTSKRDAWAKLNVEIGERNRQLIDECDVVFAVLDGVDVDSGTAAEIGYAFARHKKIIGYRGDFRLSADNEGSIVNLQVEYFVKASGGTIISEIAHMNSAIDALKL